MVALTNFQAILAVAGGAGVGDLDAVLTAGNNTGGNDILFDASTGDGIEVEDNPAGAGFTMTYTGSDAGGGGLAAGGNLDFTAGFGINGGADGVINFLSDVVFGGTVSLTNLLSGTGSPETVEIAAISTIYQRTDGGAGNALYVKMAGAAATGWCPMGPPVFETFVSVGAAAFVTGRAVFDDPVTLGVENLAVYWNGVLQREGGGDDYTVVFGGASATITFTVTPPTSDLITIRYLPE